MADVLVLNADGMPLSEIPLSVVSWQVAIRLVSLGKVQVIKEFDDWIVRSQYLNMKVPSIVICSQQVKWTKRIKYSRNNIYLRDDFTCQLQTTRKCKQSKGKHALDDLTLDHVIPRAEGGTTSWTNIITSCSTCNGDKGDDKSILPKRMPYKPTYYEILAKRKKLPIAIKDEAWKMFIDWPEELIHVVPHSGAGKSKKSNSSLANALLKD